MVEKTGPATTRSIGWTVQELPSSEDLDDYPDKRIAVSWDHRSTLSFTKSLITSLKKVNWKIGEFIDGWNRQKRSFAWTRTWAQALEKPEPQTISET